MPEEVQDLEGVHAFVINNTSIKCEVSCKDCPFLKRCKNLPSENLTYSVSSRFAGSELAKSAALFPSLILESDDKIRKLYQLIVELFINTKFNRRWNALDIAKNLSISVYRVRKRIEFLIQQKFISEKSGNRLELTIGESTNSLVAFYVETFQSRFKNKPHVAPKDVDAIVQLLKEYSKDDIEKMIKSYVWMKDEYLYRIGYPLSQISMRVNRLIMEINKGNSYRQSLEKNIK